jgi:hypothetical protein
LLSTKAHSSHRVEFEYLVFPLRAWAGAKKVYVEVRWPASWDFARPQLDGAPPFEVTEQGLERMATTQADGARAGSLQLTFSVRGTTVVHGGPLIGVGGQFEPGEVRLRAGWEIAGPEWATYAVVGETNAKDRFAFAATVDASLPNVLLLFPALGIGAGPIVGNGPRGAFGGARIQATISWPFLSMVIPIDITGPSFTSGSGPLVTGAILAQASF